MTDRFDEETLLSAVVAHWGPFGAHADVTRWMIAEIKRLHEVGDALVAAIRNHDLTEQHVKAWEEIRRG